MATPTDDRPDLMTVVAYGRAAPGKREELRAGLESLVESTRSDKGVLDFDLHQSLHDPDFFCLYENWESGEDLDAHLEAPHSQELGAQMPGLLDASGWKVNRVRRIA